MAANTTPTATPTTRETTRSRKTTHSPKSTCYVIRACRRPAFSPGMASARLDLPAWLAADTETLAVLVPVSRVASLVFGDLHVAQSL
jgi:hypothetical protein